MIIKIPNIVIYDRKSDLAGIVRYDRCERIDSNAYTDRTDRLNTRINKIVVLFSGNTRLDVKICSCILSARGVFVDRRNRAAVIRCVP